MKDFVIRNKDQSVIIGTSGEATAIMIADRKKNTYLEMELSEVDMIAIRDHMTARLDEIYDNALAQII